MAMLLYFLLFAIICFLFPIVMSIFKVEATFGYPNKHKIYQSSWNWVGGCFLAVGLITYLIKG